MASIQKETKRSKPFASKGQEASVSILRTASTIRRELEAHVNEHGITLQQFNVLRILRGAGESLPTMEIADRMVEPEPGITRLLGRIEKKGQISRTRCPQDARRILVEITKSGLDTLDLVGDPANSVFEQDSSSLTNAEIQVLLSLLEKVRSDFSI